LKDEKYVSKILPKIANKRSHTPNPLWEIFATTGAQATSPSLARFTNAVYKLVAFKFKVITVIYWFFLSLYFILEANKNEKGKPAVKWGPRLHQSAFTFDFAWPGEAAK
jgi:hypothetical protein